MPAIKTKELEQLLFQREYERIVLKRIHSLFYMIIHVSDGTSLLHYNKEGRPKEYRYAEQAKEWLERKFGIVEVEVELGAH